MYSWYDNENGAFYHNDKGLILGSVSTFNGQYKAVLDKIFIGWYINEDYAKKAVEEAYKYEQTGKLSSK